MAWLSLADAAQQAHPKSFLAFRRFTHAVALGFCYRDGGGHDDIILMDNLMLNLVRDLPPGRQPLEMARAVVAALRPRPHLQECRGYPFLLLADILLSWQAGDVAQAETTAGVLLEVEMELRQGDRTLVPGGFLFDFCWTTELNKPWLECCRTLGNPNGHPDMEKLLGRLEDERRNPSRRRKKK